MTSDDRHFIRVALAASFLVAILVIVSMVALVTHGPAVPTGTRLAVAAQPAPSDDENAVGQGAGIIAKPPVRSSSDAGCSDSDGGKAFFQKGAVTTPLKTLNDVCTTGTSLREYYCQSGWSSRIDTTCTYGCFDGRCVGQDEI